jgi:hypothetical protein
MIPKKALPGLDPAMDTGFPPCAKPCHRIALSRNASAGEARSETIMPKQQT